MGWLDSILPSTKRDNELVEYRVAKLDKNNPAKSSGRLMKAASLALGLTSTYGSRGTFLSSSYEAAPYDFDTIIAAIDTDSYAKQAFAKYQELMWKEGYELVSENPESISYIYQRFDFMELAMKTPISEFFKSITDQLCKHHNAIVAEVRNPDFKKVFPGRLETGSENGPIVGYEIIPIETVRVKRDNHNKPLEYVQELEGYGGVGQPSYPKWDASEIIHFKLDCKPGYIFGTPFMTASLDDIRALRIMEEDVQNLVHQELFPIVDVTVGTEENPGEDEEVIQAADEINSMRNDGALIHTERRKIEIIGAQGNALDAKPYLDINMQRVAIGLGLFPHHLGMTFGGGNRSMTEQLDTILYDRIKTYQRYVADMIVIFITNELLREGGFDPSQNTINKTKSDKCIFKFKEIDNDTRIKKETHEIQKFVSNVQTLTETRLAVGLSPEMDESDTFAALQARLTPQPMTGTLTDVTKDTQEPSKGGVPNRKNNRRGVGNAVRPQNQHGRSLSPNLKHSDEYGVSWIDAANILIEMEKDADD